MDIEELSKSQIVLLTLLTSFVTSIATGIVTVSLMQQAPPVIAQTVNRVVERTVEKLIPQKEGQTASAATTVTKEKTVVVKESDLIPEAVGQALPSVVRIYASTEEGSVFLGLGLVISKNGEIVADSSSFLLERGTAAVALPDGTKVLALITARSETLGTASLSAATTTDKGPINWHPAMVSSAPGLGASIIALSGKVSTHIASGIVTAVPGGEPQIIETDVVTDSILPGTPLIDTSGNVIGISTGVSRASQSSGFIGVMALHASSH